MRRLALVPALLLSLLGFGGAPVATAADGLKDGDYVAVIGDSITEQKLYSLNIESYLLMCQPKKGLSATKFGWGGETADGFSKRMANDCLRFKPVVATTCFGMNDGNYHPFEQQRFEAYQAGVRRLIDRARDEAGARLVLMTPPPFDPYRRAASDPDAA